MSIIINPLDAAIQPDNVAEIAACKMWLPFDEEGSTTESLNDAVSGGSYPLAAARTINGDGSITLKTEGTVAPTFTLPVLTGDFAILLAIEKDAAVISFQYGGSSGGQYVTLSNSGSAVVGDVGSDNLGTFGGTGIEKWMVTYDESGNGLLYSADQDTSLLAGAGTPVAATNATVTTDGDLDFSAIAGSGNMNIWGLAVIDMSTLPADFVVWADWTMEQWLAGNKVLPEIWKRA